MQLPSLWQVFYFIFVYQLNVGLTLSPTSNGTSFTTWSEDDWLENRFLINTKFMFNRQRYEHITLRSRMNEWSLELSYGNKSHLNRLWTELHFFVDRLRHGTSLNNSIHRTISNTCEPPVISPITNDSNTRIPKLIEMDERIAKYFISDGFFRTINYVNCSINELRQNPLLHIRMDIYLVTNRDFQSLIFIEMSDTTQKFFRDRQARFYLHNHELNFKYNLNVSNINRPLNSDTSLVHMIKLYKQSKPMSNHSVIISWNSGIILFYFFVCQIFF